MNRLKNFVCREGFAEVDTRAGRLRGFLEDDIYNFRGVTYAHAERFLPAQPVEPWEGVRPATDYGYTCPQMSPARLMGELMNPHRFWPEDEDCLNLNIWTRTLDPKARQPVMVWLHGGGYTGGSAVEMLAYDGANQARYGNVVSVTVNHRLNVLGFLDLSEYDPAYQASGNAGIADLAAALRWIHENIAAFGGDPDNVTIYGQSGGGGKVTTLMQMPSADGLYHRAVIESGIIHLEGEANTAMRITREAALENTRKLVAHVGDWRKLTTMPVAELMQACHDTFHNPMIWTPVPGAGDFAGDPGQVGLRPETAHIPVMIGCSLCEFAFGLPSVDKSALTEEEKQAALAARYGDRAETVRAAFRAAYPGVNDYYAVAAMPMAFRPDVVDYCAKRAAMATAPVYQYVMAYESALNGGTMSWHCAEIPFIFHNADFTGAVYNGEQTWVTQDEMFGAWMSFARSGDPNHDGLCRWEPYTADRHACMIFGAPSACRVDHDADLIALLDPYKNPMKPMMG